MTNRLSTGRKKIAISLIGMKTESEPGDIQHLKCLFSRNRALTKEQLDTSVRFIAKYNNLNRGRIEKKFCTHFDLLENPQK